MPGQVIFKPIASLPAGGQITVKVTATAQKPGNLQFRAELSCGEPETKLVSEETTRFYGSATDNSAPQSAERSAGEPTPAAPVTWLRHPATAVSDHDPQADRSLDSNDSG